MLDTLLFILGLDPPLDWPSRGEVRMERIFVRYADTLPPVLKDVTLYVKPGEKVCRRLTSTQKYQKKTTIFLFYWQEYRYIITLVFIIFAQ